MTPVPTVLRRSILLAGVALACTAPAALAAQNTTITLGGPAAKSLKAQGVKVSPVSPAKGSGSRLTLPTGSVVISGSTATVGHEGSLRLSAGGRSVTLGSLQVVVGAKPALSAIVDGERTTIATIDANRNRRSVSASGTYVTEAPVVLTGATVRMLRSDLRKPKLAGGRIGTIDLEASSAGHTSTGASDIPGAPPATVTGPPTAGGATAATRPASAVAITGGTAKWAPRTSWIGYVAQGEGTSATAPATFDGTAFTLPITGGWYDAASGKGVINTSGTTNFRFTNHTIDMAFSNWSFDLAGATPKAVALVDKIGTASPAVGTRQPIMLAKLGSIKPTTSGSTATWTDVPLTLSGEGVPIYRAYLYDTDQGTLSVSATIG